jgi:hypothetical protein
LTAHLHLSSTRTQRPRCASLSCTRERGARRLASAVDPFALIMLGGVAGLVVVLVLLGRFYPGSGAEQLRWRPTRSPELEVQNEIDDFEQMREAVNRRRRARGEPELTEGDLHARVAEDQRERRRLLSREGP